MSLLSSLLSGEMVHQSVADRGTKLGITFLLSEWCRNCTETIELRFQCGEFEVSLLGISFKTGGI